MRLGRVLRWLPWRWMLRRAARAQGFLDPLALMARLRRFGQPSEVAEPIELLRAGMVFHARGLVNTRVIQHNLDWIWPYWIEQQFDPYSQAFLPRAFSITHVNLTHRNWTAVGQPDCAALPIVDPRGLLTPLDDGWSIDAWLYAPDGRRLHPSKVDRAEQWWDRKGAEWTLITRIQAADLAIEQRHWVVREAGQHWLYGTYTASAPQASTLVLSLRPYNPEGVSFIHQVSHSSDADGAGRWLIDDGQPNAHPIALTFDAEPNDWWGSDYPRGDVANAVEKADAASPAAQTLSCETGLVTAAAGYRLPASGVCSVTLRMPLPVSATQHQRQTWAQALDGIAHLSVPDPTYCALYQAGLRTLALHSVEEIYPGPYTYRRFWFRDAAFIIHALLNVGFQERAEQALARFPARQNRATGYFHSQEGEWDSNGQVLWIVARFQALTGYLPQGLNAVEWRRILKRGAQWIARKRLTTNSTRPEAGLLPAGFSAEHLGANDFYYWDDDWSVAGLYAAADVAAEYLEDGDLADWMRGQASAFADSIQRAQQADAERLDAEVIPASPYRRMDAGAVGSLAAGYPLQLRDRTDQRLLGTVDYLLKHQRVHGGFFQDMIHSGVNAYLTLHMAQVLLRAGDARGLELIDAVAELASPTGQWPEAIHPRTLGGCMGDGQHVWATAEWVNMLRNSFCREEGNGLVLASGIQPRWLRTRERIAFGPTPTPFGAVEVWLEPDVQHNYRIHWSITPKQSDTHSPAWVQVALPGHQAVTVQSAQRSVPLPAAAA